MLDCSKCAWRTDREACRICKLAQEEEVKREKTLGLEQAEVLLDNSQRNTEIY